MICCIIPGTGKKVLEGSDIAALGERNFKI
jgi:hypothetical protein